MNESKEALLAQLKQERHTTMIEKVYASQETYAQLEQARKDLAGVKRFQFAKKRQMKQQVAALAARMVALDNEIEAAHQKYQQGLKKLEAE